MLRKKIAMFCGLATLLLLGSCTEMQSFITPISGKEGVENFLQSRSLKIAQFVEDGEDETAYFRNYHFLFKEDGVVIARTASEEIMGRYWLFKDDGKTELKMLFPLSRNFNELNDDWYFAAIDESTITFSDSGDTLIFEVMKEDEQMLLPLSLTSEIDDLNSFLQYENGFRIGQFIEEGENETAYFKNFRFLFASNGEVTARSASDEIIGRYWLIKDDGETELKMLFPPLRRNLNELNDDWYLVAKNDTTISFADSGDKLIFEKIN